MAAWRVATWDPGCDSAITSIPCWRCVSAVGVARCSSRVESGLFLLEGNVRFSSNAAIAARTCRSIQAVQTSLAGRAVPSDLSQYPQFMGTVPDARIDGQGLISVESWANCADSPIGAIDLWPATLSWVANWFWATFPAVSVVISCADMCHGAGSAGHNSYRQERNSMEGRRAFAWPITSVNGRCLVLGAPNAEELEIRKVAAAMNIKKGRFAATKVSRYAEKGGLRCLAQRFAL